MTSHWQCVCRNFSNCTLTLTPLVVFSFAAGLEPMDVGWHTGGPRCRVRMQNATWRAKPPRSTMDDIEFYGILEDCVGGTA